MIDVKRYYVGVNTKCLGGIGLVEMTDLYREATGFCGLVSGDSYDKLKAENESLRGQIGRDERIFGMAADDLVRDAARYRWLKDFHIGDDPESINLDTAPNR